MSREEFDGVPDTGKGETAKLIGVQYEDRSTRRNAEYRMERSDVEVQNAPRMTAYVIGDTEEVEDTLDSIKSKLEETEDGDLYVFEEERQQNLTGLEKLEENEFRYEEIIPDTTQREVGVALDTYVMSRDDLEQADERQATDGNNTLSWNVENTDRNPTVEVKFEGQRDFAGKHTTNIRDWLEEAL
ncbi:MAG: hypothetical protein ABEJ03_02760 [Candidatus Nanohaloarchaea archaeon]